ncbi:MAG: hypothetical protein ACOVQ4_07195 [Flectobacillus sp.]|uniref:hypothetical protein n=1 Tax=Flectobacillus sp. TaxID=50419 RepID=UPI003B99E393
MTNKTFNTLDCSIASYQLIKKESEKYWENIKLDTCWGWQIQKDSKWKTGLSEIQLEDFQKKLGLTFSESLKNYFRTMNGLDKLGINNKAGEGEIEFGTTFYSYPDDIDTIKSQIAWILKENNLTDNTLNVPPIIPYLGHRFLILDEEESVLSMYGNDIIFWAENLSKGLASDIFSIHATIDTDNIKMNTFWNKRIM